MFELPNQYQFKQPSEIYYLHIDSPNLKNFGPRVYVVENVKLNLLFSLILFTKKFVLYENSTYSFPFPFHGKILKHFARSFHEAQTLKLGGVVYAWNSITIVPFTYFFEPKKSIMPHLNNKNDVISLYFFAIWEE